MDLLECVPELSVSIVYPMLQCCYFLLKLPFTPALISRCYTVLVLLVSRGVYACGGVRKSTPVNSHDTLMSLSFPL